MDHPHVDIGTALLTHEKVADYFSLADSVPPTRGHIALAVAGQRRHKTTNLLLRLRPGALSSGITNLKVLSREALAGRWPDQFARHLGRVLGDIDGVARAPVAVSCR